MISYNPYSTILERLHPRVVVDCNLRRNGGGDIGTFVVSLRLEEDILIRVDVNLDVIKRRASLGYTERPYSICNLIEGCWFRVGDCQDTRYAVSGDIGPKKICRFL